MNIPGHTSRIRAILVHVYRNLCDRLHSFHTSTVELRYNDLLAIKSFWSGPVFLSSILHVFIPGYNNPYSQL